MRPLRTSLLSIRSLSTVIVVLVAVVSLVVTPSQAQEVTAFLGASGPGLASMSFNNISTPDVGNDNFVGTSPNQLNVNQKAYDTVGYIDMVFQVSDVGVPATEYVLNEGVANSTGEDWSDYHLELGFGTGAGFYPSTAGDGLDFDSPDYDSPYTFAPFTSITFGEDTMDAIGGIVPSGSFYVFSFPIDVPETITEFTVRQWPSVSPVAAPSASFGKVKSQY